MSEIKNIFGVDPEDKSLQAKQGGVFGLNTGYITKLQKIEGETEGKPYKAIDLTVLIGDKEYFNRFFLSESVFNNNNVLLSPGDEGYENAFFNQYVQVASVIKHALGALGVTKNQINNALVGIDSTKLLEGMEKLTSLLPAGFQNKPVDIFLEYQWNIPEGRDMTYLVLPKNMKGGEFLCASVPHIEPWTEVRDDEGLHYISGGVTHPFIKNKAFMESKKAIQQTVGNNNTNDNTPSPSKAAETSTWV